MPLVTAPDSGGEHTSGGHLRIFLVRWFEVPVTVGPDHRGRGIPQRNVFHRGAPTSCSVFDITY